MAALGREIHDLQAELQAVLDRWPKGKAAALGEDAKGLLADVQRLAQGVEVLLEPEHETPGERAGGAARPRRHERDRSTPGSRAAQNARSGRRIESDLEGDARRRDRDMTPGTRGAIGAETLIDDL